MSPGQERQAGFTITELMVVLVIIGLLAAVATPSLTRDSTARKGRDFANFVAQGMQRAHLNAMSLRVANAASVCLDNVAFYRTDNMTAPLYVANAPAGTTIWNAVTDNSVPTGRVLTTSRPSGCALIYFNTMGNVGTTTASANLANYKIYIRNESLSQNHPDAGFLVSMTGLTSFVSTTSFSFSQ